MSQVRCPYCKKIQPANKYSLFDNEEWARIWGKQCLYCAWRFDPEQHKEVKE